jgi:hypothetical protein
MKPKLLNPVTLSLALLLSIPLTCLAEDALETLLIGTNTLHNVRVIQSSPVDVLLGHDDGYQRIKLQDLPAPLKAKYPYDPKKAEEYKNKQAQDARLRAAQNSATIRANLLAREQDIRNRIGLLEKDLQRINADIGVQDRRAKGKKPKSRDRQYADELRRKKMEVRDHIWQLRDELEATQAQRLKYE